jgi:hypothetical protein
MYLQEFVVFNLLNYSLFYTFLYSLFSPFHAPTWLHPHNKRGCQVEYSRVSLSAEDKFLPSCEKLLSLLKHLRKFDKLF